MLNRVEYGGESFVVERGGKPVCRIEPVTKNFTCGDLADLLKSLPKPDPEFWDDVEWATKNQGTLPVIDW